MDLDKGTKTDAIGVQEEPILHRRVRSFSEEETLVQNPQLSRTGQSSGEACCRGRSQKVQSQ